VDFYEDGIYLVIVVAAFVLVVGAIMLMSRSMRVKKQAPKKEAIASGYVKPEAAGAQSQKEVKGRSEPQAKHKEHPQEKRKEELEDESETASPDLVEINPLAEESLEDAKEHETASLDLLEINPLAEESLEDAKEHETASLDLLEINPPTEESLENAEEPVKNNDLMSFFEADELEYADVVNLATRLPDVDLDGLRELSEELLRISVRARQGGSHEYTR
jgi:hypothetical protein